MGKGLVISFLLASLICITNGETMNTIDEKIVDGLLNPALSGNRAYASSFLKEKNMPEDFYSPNKARDGDINTAWAITGKNNGIGEFIVFKIAIGVQSFPQKFPIETDIIIVNGCATSNAIFKKNNRVKKASLEIYELEMRGAQDKTHIAQMPILNSTTTLEFKDSMKPQIFKIEIDNKLKVENFNYAQFAYIGKLIIEEIYKGTEYNDLCISEISFKPKNK